MDKHVYSINLGGEVLDVEFNNLALRAHGSCIVRQGGTVVLATAVMSKHPKKDCDFLPLTVEYEEKFYAHGKILGSRFLRREGKPSDEAILAGRIIDRTVRPLFDQWIRNDIQIIISVLSIGTADPGLLAVLGTSLALSTSHIPWNGPVSGIRVMRNAGSKQFVVNPTFENRHEGEMDIELVACGKEGTLNMIELGGNETSEESAIDALGIAAHEIAALQKFQKKIIRERGVAKLPIPEPKIPSKVVALFDKYVADDLVDRIFKNSPGDMAIEELKEDWLALIAKKIPKVDHVASAISIFESSVNEAIHHEAISNERRTDGRGLNDIRPLFAQAGKVSQMLHGSGIFYRGETHIFSALTLGGPNDTLTPSEAEASDEKKQKRFMHHYNFPPFSTGDTGRTGSPNRRMIGHGALAEKSLLPVIPSKEIFPYTIRLVSEAFSSNGSTSMASVCASTVALMDGGVPIARPVAGISLGIMLKNNNSYKILTDIQGPEDHYGDMDFKVAGTRNGITAVQMDVKVDGIPLGVFKEAFSRARSARMSILSVIKSAIPTPRKNISIHAPHILTLKIKQEMIGLVIGPGGKNINSIIKQTGVSAIDIGDDGTVFVTGRHDTVDKAIAMIKESSADRRSEGRPFVTKQ